MKTPMASYGNAGPKVQISKNLVNDVTAVIININDRPRKKLGYKTPASLMAKHMAAIAA